MLGCVVVDWSLVEILVLERDCVDAVDGKDSVG